MKAWNLPQAEHFKQENHLQQLKAEQICLSCDTSITYHFCHSQALPYSGCQRSLSKLLKQTTGNMLVPRPTQQRQL